MLEYAEVGSDSSNSSDFGAESLVPSHRFGTIVFAAEAQPRQKLPLAVSIFEKTMLAANVQPRQKQKVVPFLCFVDWIV